MTDPRKGIRASDLDELDDVWPRTETERILGDTRFWPLRVLPVKRAGRDGGMEVGYVEQDARGVVPAVVMPGGRRTYASVEDIVNDGWRVD